MEPEEPTGGERPLESEAVSESVLVVDDDPFIARLLEIELRAAGYEVRVGGDGEEALGLANERTPDLVLADVMMPKMDGFELTRRLRQDPRTASVSIIMLTARGLSSDKLEGFSAGADDYIVKPFDTPELLARVRGVLRRAREMRAQSPLTGLPGNVRIEEEIEARVDKSDDFAILYADLDYFKAFNDHYGFMRGDSVIQMTARLLQDVALSIGGPETFVGHVGGDDFIGVLEPGQVEVAAEEIIGCWDERVSALYDPEDLERGYIEVPDRQSQLHRFAVMKVSIGIATNRVRPLATHWEAAEIATEMKQFAKQEEKSAFAIDRRREPPPAPPAKT
jgi:diguanylate cyclase (GGDEF)-like protein